LDPINSDQQQPLLVSEISGLLFPVLWPAHQAKLTTEEEKEGEKKRKKKNGKVGKVNQSEP
jgi:hypothetical protein